MDLLFNEEQTDERRAGVFEREAVVTALMPGLIMIVAAVAANFLEQEQLSMILSLIGVSGIGAGGTFARGRVFSQSTHDRQLSAAVNRRESQIAAELNEWQRAEREQAENLWEAKLEENAFDGPVGDQYSQGPASWDLEPPSGQWVQIEGGT